MWPLFPCEQRRHGISRFPCKVFPCVPEVFDRAGNKRLSHYRCVRYCLPLRPTTSAPWTLIGFRGSIPSPHVPLSTLRSGPCGPQRMTQGRCGSLHLHRMTLSFTTPHRFSSALSGHSFRTCCMRRVFTDSGEGTEVFMYSGMEVGQYHGVTGSCMTRIVTERELPEEVRSRCQVDPARSARASSLFLPLHKANTRELRFRFHNLRPYRLSR